jgi:Zn-dependent M16 (insulinase) family peptidase
VLVQQRIAMEQSFANEGHAKASARLQSYLFGNGVLADRLSGVGYYLFLKDLIAHFDERFDRLKAKLAQVSAQIFVKNDVVVSFTGAPEDRARFFELAGDFGLPVSPEPPLGLYAQIPRPEIKREAFIVPSDVSYVAKGADVHQISDYAGAWVVLGNALSLDYLWNEVRVKGGAYGVGFKRTPMGFARFYSFRDPHIDETIERYDRAAEWIAAFDPSEEEMEGYIVSTVASHDAPVKPRLVARRQDVGYFAHRAPVWREMLRDQELRVTPDAVRACAPTLRAVSASPAVCVFGSRETIEGAATSFNRVVDLLAE